MRFSSPAVWLFVLSGACVGWLVASLVPAGLRTPFLHQQDFHLARKDGQPAEITPSRWLFLPFLYGDFDLRMDVELAADTDLDVLVRQVEPRIVGETMLPFAGRFAALRLTTGTEGPGWRSRDDAVRSGRFGGVSLAPGYAASVWIEGRGRTLTANVAGKLQGTCTAADEYGMFALLVRGGNAVVHSLEIVAKGQPRAWLWSRWLWMALGAAGALGIGAIAGHRGAHGSWFVTTALPLPLLAWLVVRRADLDLAFPAPAAMAAVLGGCLLVGVARLFRSTGLLGTVACIAAVLLATGDRLLRHDDRAIEALFGRDAGSQISEAMAQLVREPDVETAKGLVRGPLIDVAQPGPHVFLLGGNQLYGGGAPSEHLAPLLRRELRASAKLPVQVAALPTEDGHTRQQVDLFLQCFTGYRPKVVVFGVGADEMAFDERTRAPRSSPEHVQFALTRARTWCDESGSKLVLFAAAKLPAELLAVLREAAGKGVPLVEAVDGSAPIDVARRLAAAVAPLLAP